MKTNIFKQGFTTVVILPSLLTMAILGVSFSRGVVVSAEVCVNGMTVDSCSSVGQCPQAEPDCNSDVNSPTSNQPLNYTSLNDGGSGQDRCSPSGEEELNENNCTIIKYLVNGINFLSAVVGLAAVFSITWAGYQYITSRDNPQAVSAAKNRIVITILALLIYMFMWAFLQYLVPGGVL